MKRYNDGSLKKRRTGPGWVDLLKNRWEIEGGTSPRRGGVKGNKTTLQTAIYANKKEKSRKCQIKGATPPKEKRKYSGQASARASSGRKGEIIQKGENHGERESSTMQNFRVLMGGRPIEDRLSSTKELRFAFNK